jgi:hypothetical protein
MIEKFFILAILSEKINSSLPGDNDFSVSFPILYLMPKGCSWEGGKSPWAPVPIPI